MEREIFIEKMAAYCEVPPSHLTNPISEEHWRILWKWSQENFGKKVTKKRMQNLLLWLCDAPEVMINYTTLKPFGINKPKVK